MNAVVQLAEKHYEQRLVIYFDILGWREIIAESVNHPQLVTIMHNFLSLIVSMGKTQSDGDGRISTFSDNAVITRSYDQKLIPTIIQALCTIQIGILEMGFLLRGALSIGKIYHDEFAVFGPALVRAYELESKHANYPRFILDPDTPLGQIDHPFVRQIDGYPTLYPFNVDFFQWSAAQSPTPHLNAIHHALTGHHVPYAQPKVQEAVAVHAKARSLVAHRLAHTHDPKNRAKVQWLLDQFNI